MLQRVRRRFQPVADGSEQMQLAEIPGVLNGARGQPALGVVGLAVSGALGVLAAGSKWRGATAVTPADLRRFGGAARDLIEAPPRRKRRAPLVIACTGVVARPSLFRAPARQRADAKGRRRRQSLRLIERRARLTSAG